MLPSTRSVLNAEGAGRQVRSIAYQIFAARLPALCGPTGVDFHASAVEKALVRTLRIWAFTEAAHNVMLIGSPGTDKTHLATVLGVKAVRRHGTRALPLDHQTDQRAGN
jgi:DNA replication protein DnaC